MAPLRLLYSRHEIRAAERAKRSPGTTPSSSPPTTPPTTTAPLWTHQGVIDTRNATRMGWGVVCSGRAKLNILCYALSDREQRRNPRAFVKAPASSRPFLARWSQRIADFGAAFRRRGHPPRGKLVSSAMAAAPRTHSTLADRTIRFALRTDAPVPPRVRSYHHTSVLTAAGRPMVSERIFSRQMESLSAPTTWSSPSPPAATAQFIQGNEMARIARFVSRSPSTRKPTAALLTERAGNGTYPSYDVPLRAILKNRKHAWNIESNDQRFA